MSQALVQCDCCDFFTIPEGEDYEICPVCFWEQEGWGLEEPDEPSGANNGLTLRDGRRNFVAIGVCEPQFKSKVVSEIERKNFAYEPRSL